MALAPAAVDLTSEWAATHAARQQRVAGSTKEVAITSGLAVLDVWCTKSEKLHTVVVFEQWLATTIWNRRSKAFKAEAKHAHEMLQAAVSLADEQCLHEMELVEQALQELNEDGFDAACAAAATEALVEHEHNLTIQYQVSTLLISAH